MTKDKIIITAEVALRKRIEYFKKILHSRPPRLVYVGGWYGQKNLGDEALVKAYQNIFRRYSLVFFPKGRGRLISYLSRHFGFAKCAVLAGGTLINRQIPLNSFKRCQDLYPNFFVFGTGVANPYFWNRYSEWKDTLNQWKTVLENCVYVGVRGPLSAEILDGIGIKADVIGDPVITFCDEQILSEDGILPNSVGFNIGQSYGRMWGDEATIKEQYIRLARIVKKAGWKIRWFIVFPEDRNITMQVARASETENEVYEVYQNPKTFIDLVRPLSVFVGMKLHSVVLATCAFVPSIMLEYRPKCLDYMMSIQQEACTVRTDRFRAEQVWDIINTLNEERLRLTCLLQKKITYLRNKQIEKSQQLMDCFEKG